jgi:hypothetical protein
MFCAPDSFSAVLRAFGTVFMFYAPGHVFGGTESVGSHFNVLRSRTHFRRYRGRRVPFSCFAIPDSNSDIPRASGPVFMFCVPGLIFGGTEGVLSLFHVLRPRTYFRRCLGCKVTFLCFARPNWFQRSRGRRVLFSCFAHPDSFSAVQGVSDPIFMFFPPGHVFGSTVGFGSRFHVLRARTRFRRYRGRRVPFSYFVPN